MEAKTQTGQDLNPNPPVTDVISGSNIPSEHITQRLTDSVPYGKVRV